MGKDPDKSYCVETEVFFFFVTVGAQSDQVTFKVLEVHMNTV